MSYGIDKPSGLVPFRHLLSSTWNNQTNGASSYTIRSGYNTSIFSGDYVIYNAGDRGYLIPGTGATNEQIVGVFAGCQYKDSTGLLVSKPYWPANTVGTDIVAYLYDDPFIVYNIQCGDSVGAVNALLISHIGNNCNIEFDAGNTSSGITSSYLDLNDLNTPAGLNVKIVGLTPYPGGNAFGLAHNNALVVINNHILKAGTARV